MTETLLTAADMTETPTASNMTETAIVADVWLFADPQMDPHKFDETPVDTYSYCWRIGWHERSVHCSAREPVPSSGVGRDRLS